MGKVLRCSPGCGIMGFEHVKKWKVSGEDGKYLLIVGEVEDGISPKFRLVHSSVRKDLFLTEDHYYFVYEMDKRELVINTKAPIYIKFNEISQELSERGYTRHVIVR